MISFITAIVGCSHSHVHQDVRITARALALLLTRDEPLVSREIWKEETPIKQIPALGRR